MRNLDVILEERDRIEKILISFLNFHSRVHHPYAGYVLSKSVMSDFEYLFAKLTFGIDNVSLAYLTDKFVRGTLDARYFHQRTLPIDRQSSDYTENCMSVRIFSEWSDSHVRSYKGTTCPETYFVL